MFNINTIYISDTSNAVVFCCPLLSLHPCLLSFKNMSGIVHKSTKSQFLTTRDNIFLRLQWLKTTNDIYNNMIINVLKSFVAFVTLEGTKN